MLDLWGECTTRRLHFCSGLAQGYYVRCRVPPSQRKGQGVLHQGKSSVWQNHADAASELWKNL